MVPEQGGRSDDCSYLPAYSAEKFPTGETRGMLLMADPGRPASRRSRHQSLLPGARRLAKVVDTSQPASQRRCPERGRELTSKLAGVDEVIVESMPTAIGAG